MTELGVKGTLCGIGGSIGLEVLDCAEKQASKGPGGKWGEGRENGFQASVGSLLMASPHHPVSPWKPK